MPPSRTRSLAVPVAIVLVALLAAILRVIPIDDPDYHWHLHTGRWIALHRAIPAVDPFSHTFFGAPWAFVDWPSDLFMYGLHRLGGDALVVIAFALVGGAAVFLSVMRGEEAPSARLAIVLLVAVAVMFRITPRPQTLTFLLMALLVWLLDRVRREESSLAWVPLLIALFQNLHGSAVLGVMVVFAYALGAALDGKGARAFAIAAVLSLGALFVSVRPVARLVAGFAHLGDRRVAFLFPEWGNAFRAGAFGPHVVALIALMALAAVGFARTKRTLGLGGWLAGMGLALLGLASVRFVPLAALVLAPCAAAGLAELSLRSRWSWCAVFACGCVLFGFRVRRPGLGLARGAFPERAAALLRAEDLRGKLWNDFAHGGYLLFTLGEQGWPVSLDGRSMAVYGVEFVEKAVTAVGPKLDKALAHYDVDIVVVAPDLRVGSLSRTGDWLLVSFDDTAAVLVRGRDAPERARARAYRAIHPTTWFDLSLLGDRKIARAEAERAVEEAPDSSIAHAQRIAVAIADGDFTRADALLAEADGRFPGSQRILRAHLLRCTDDRACTCRLAREIQQKFPRNSYTAELLARHGCP